MRKQLLEWGKRCVRREFCTSVHRRWRCVTNPRLAVEEIRSTLEDHRRAVLILIRDRGEVILSRHRLVSGAKRAAEELTREGKV